MTPACHQLAGFPLVLSRGVRQRKTFSWLGVDTPECAGGTHGGCRAGRERRGELVAHATRFAGVIFPLPDVPPYTRPAEACAPPFSLSTLLRSAAHRKTQARSNEEPRRIAPHLFRLPLFTRARPPRRETPYPLGAPGSGNPPPHPKAAFLFWCACTASIPPISCGAHKSPPTWRATLHYSGGCSSCSHIVSWGVGMIPATMHPVSSCCA